MIAVRCLGYDWDGTPAPGYLATGTPSIKLFEHPDAAIYESGDDGDTWTSNIPPKLTAERPIDFSRGATLLPGCLTQFDHCPKLDNPLSARPVHQTESGGNHSLPVQKSTARRKGIPAGDCFSNEE